MTAGNTLIVVGYAFSETFDMVTDTLGNTWTQQYRDQASEFEMFLASGVTGGANSVTISPNAGGEGAYLQEAIILEVAGLAPNPFDGGIGKGDTGGGSVNTGTFSTTAANDLLLIVGIGQAPVAETSGRTLVASFTQQDYPYTRAVWTSLAATPGSYSATMTSGGEGLAVIFGFKTASAGGSTTAVTAPAVTTTSSSATTSTAVTYVWSGTGPLVYAGNTYQGVGSLGSIGTISEGTEVEAKGTSIGLSGIDLALLGDCLADIQVGAPATLSLALLDQSGAVVGVPYPLYAGTVDKVSIEIGAETISISLALENRLTNLQRASNRRYTAADQALTYPTDMAFNWVEILNDIALRWGS